MITSFLTSLFNLCDLVQKTIKTSSMFILHFFLLILGMFLLIAQKMLELNIATNQRESLVKATKGRFHNQEKRQEASH